LVSVTGQAANTTILSITALGQTEVLLLEREASERLWLYPEIGRVLVGLAMKEWEEIEKASEVA